jgi:dynein heavy chain
MMAAGAKIDQLIDECQKYYRANDSSDYWKAYLQYIDELVIDGLLNAMAASVGYLLDETDSYLTQGVLFEVRLELSEPDVIFQPPLDKAILGNFFDQVNISKGGCTALGLFQKRDPNGHYL